MKSRKSWDSWEYRSMHIPVLLQEVIRMLELQKGDRVVDGTLGGGGHASEILKKIGSDGIFVGIEWDSGILEETKKNLSKTPLCERNGCRFVWGNYKDIGDILKRLKIGTVNAILVDAGFSSFQVDDPERGFSFQKDGPLDMRYNQREGISASAVVNSFAEEALADILYVYGQEHMARKIARVIVQERKKHKIMRTGELKKIVEQVLGAGRRSGIHAATRVFQALRVYVNDELGNLQSFLGELPLVLAPGGRCAVISFHSLEDRAVKQAFRDFKNKNGWEDLTKKPITPSVEEIMENPRSRSAKLRVIRAV